MNKTTFLAAVFSLMLAKSVQAQLKDAQVNLFAIPTLSTSFVRMPSRNASQEIDAVYYNPAGILGLKNGFHLNVNNQFQWVSSNLEVSKNKELQNQPTTNYPFSVKNYIFPIFHGAYIKNQKYAFSFMVTPAVGGGGASAISNLPFGEFPIADLTAISRDVIKELVDKPFGTQYSDIDYSYDFSFKGLSFSPAAQANFGFKINKYLAGSVGARMIYYIVNAGGGLSNLRFNNETLGISKSPKDYIQDMGREVPQINEEITDVIGELLGAFPLELEIEATQSGFGVTPIVGLNFNYNDRWNVGLKYEHRTYINLITKVPDPEKNGGGVYVDGKEQRADFPGMFTSGITFKPNERLIFAVGNRLFFNKRANLNGREDFLISNYKEFDAAFEYEMLPRLRISAGATYRTVRMENEYYTSIDYFLPAVTFAGGIKSTISQRIEVEAGLLFTKYLTRNYVQNVGIFGGLLPAVGIELPDFIDEAFNRRFDYEMSGLVYYASVGVNFWMGSIEENKKGREARVAQVKEDRASNQFIRQHRREYRKLRE
jgi:long-chain fatty acid transport protein